MDAFAREYGRRAKALDTSARLALETYSWPGNVRELRNIVERLIIMVPGDVITARDLAFLQGGAAAAEVPAIEREPLTLQEARARFERDFILHALARQDGNISRTADALGVERSNLYRKMRALGIAPGRSAEREEDAGLAT
jgi:two-component system nitrogen regulation response regulator NtrX